MEESRGTWEKWCISLQCVRYIYVKETDGEILLNKRLMFQRSEAMPVWEKHHFKHCSWIEEINDRLEEINWKLCCTSPFYILVLEGFKVIQQVEGWIKILIRTLIEENHHARLSHESLTKEYLSLVEGTQKDVSVGGRTSLCLYAS